ncbi:uncharacterized protein LOC134258722 isoform X1 [Saccostrea cucullata]|uniref:uncharacterized protein LOC134258722 isoform X1 n=1 Tax=Saccostrea cuccullata TaxID=36930 RepID=UPI002ED1551C
MIKDALSLLLVVMLFSIVFIEDGEGGWWRRRRRRNPPPPTTPKPIICKTLCEFECSNDCAPRCCSKCYPKCSRDFKRTDVEEVIVPLPCNITIWDKDGDGLVNKTEFIITTNARPSNKVDVNYVFGVADKNGDKFLSENELNKAPIIFDC